jgi:H+-translocating NAD(P) transhydrogenase subunit alpha
MNELINKITDLEKIITELSSKNLGLTLFIFALAIFLGVELITKVPSQLHTPLMSGSNAISGITIVGAVIALNFAQGSEPSLFLKIIGFLAVVTASINVVGGYLVTDRMLGMFKSKKKGGE